MSGKLIGVKNMAGVENFLGILVQPGETIGLFVPAPGELDIVGGPEGVVASADYLQNIMDSYWDRFEGIYEPETTKKGKKIEPEPEFKSEPEPVAIQED